MFESAETEALQKWQTFILAFFYDTRIIKTCDSASYFADFRKEKISQSGILLPSGQPIFWSEKRKHPVGLLISQKTCFCQCTHVEKLDHKPSMH